MSQPTPRPATGRVDTTPVGRGRPLEFDPDATVDDAVEMLWRRGLAATTTRSLEAELGLSQSSLYNTFGSKHEFLDRVIGRYQERLADEVLAPLATADPDRERIVGFIESLTEWVGERGRGCLVLNLAAEDPRHADRLGDYRATLRDLLTPAVASFTPSDDDVERRVDLLVASVFGLNVTARSGAPRAELNRMAMAIVEQVRDW